MCGIMAAIAKRPVREQLLAGLSHLAYRGYDSAGLAIMQSSHIARVRAVGKVDALIKSCQALPTPLDGHLGIAHTRWATHGKVTLDNAHPHMDDAERVAIVHNGIIDNADSLRQSLVTQGHRFTSETDSEVIAHLIADALEVESTLADAVRHASLQLKGSYAIAVIAEQAPEQLIAICHHSPLVLGIGVNEYYIASDIAAFAPLTQQAVFLETDDMAVLTTEHWQLLDPHKQVIERPIQLVSATQLAQDKGKYRHFMRKEIDDQRHTLPETLHSAWKAGGLRPDFLPDTDSLLQSIEHIHIVACGTSYHAGAIAHYVFEHLGISCQAEVASEYLYRQKVIPPNTLLLMISQSGETADILAVHDLANTQNYLAQMAICNVAHSRLAHAVDHALITRAGHEIGVAATKTFSSQLLMCYLLAARIAQVHPHIPADEKDDLFKQLQAFDDNHHTWISQTLDLSPDIDTWAKNFINKQHALFLGRNVMFPIAEEGALKLKEISYIHAEAYPSGELKHGPLALIDENMPVVALALNHQTRQKTLSNLAEVSARGGQCFVICDQTPDCPDTQTQYLIVPRVPRWIQPLIVSIPMQLLAYHVAVLKGTDVDQPRNLAKSVTVE